MSAFFISLCFTFVVLVLCEKRYDNFKLVKVIHAPSNLKDVLREGEDVVYFHSRGDNATILVSAEVFANLTRSDLQCEVLNDDFQRDLDEEKEPTKRFHFGFGRQDENGAIFRSFPRHSTINSFITTLAANNPNIASIETIGRSYENREMKVIRIRSGENKPVIWIDAGIHAREWAAPVTAIYIANQLVKSYKKNRAITRLVDRFEWIILPSANPDGYEYSHTTSRMWRKTRSNRGGRCLGVDPNRNWGHHWNEVGASSNPCDETYAGPSAFSEIETRNIRNYLLQRKGSLNTYFSIHAYSQLWLCPWGYTNQVPNNYNDLVEKGKLAARAIAAKYGTKYTVGSSTNVLYAAAGGSDDWALAECGAQYAYTLELRPDENGRSGFVLPVNQIVPTAEETFAGIQAFAESIM